MATLHLASGSPRRRELLAQIGVPFQVLSAAIDESVRPGETAEGYVERLAREKAAAGLAALGDAAAGTCVLGADTSVVLDGRVLGKPLDRDDALAMLADLSGREHQVLTAVAVAQSGLCRSRLVTSRVRLRVIPQAEREAYWATGEPLDKAGGYAIQGLGAVFVENIQGSYSAVVGLPLLETADLLGEFGISVWQRVG